MRRGLQSLMLAMHELPPVRVKPVRARERGKVVLAALQLHEEHIALTGYPAPLGPGLFHRCGFEPVRGFFNCLDVTRNTRSLILAVLASHQIRAPNEPGPFSSAVVFEVLGLHDPHTRLRIVIRDPPLDFEPCSREGQVSVFDLLIAAPN